MVSAQRARILVVDDEDFVRSLIVDVLANLGHQVDAASNGAEAIRRFERNDHAGKIAPLAHGGFARVTQVDGSGNGRRRQGQSEDAEDRLLTRAAQNRARLLAAAHRAATVREWFSSKDTR